MSLICNALQWFETIDNTILFKKYTNSGNLSIVVFSLYLEKIKQA